MSASRTMKQLCWRPPLLFGAALSLFAAPVAPPAQTVTAVFASRFNFDVYNDTEEVAHGTEILGGPTPTARNRWLRRPR